MGIYDKINNVKTAPKRGYFSAGNYKVSIIKVITKTKLDGGNAFIGECKVLESDNPEVPVGSQQSFYRDLNSKFPDMVLKQIAGFVLAACEARDGAEAPEGVSDELMDHVCSEENPLAGAKLNVRAIEKVSKKNTKYLEINFYPAN
jgi:hypothetical protein